MRFLVPVLFILFLLQMAGCKALNDVTGFEEEFGPFISSGNNTVPAPPACSLPFDIHPSIYSIFVIPDMLPLDITKQKSAITLQVGDTFLEGAASSTLSGVATKKTAFEFEIQMPQLNTGSTNNVFGAGIFIVNPPSDSSFAFVIEVLGNNNFHYYIRKNNNPIWETLNSPTYPSRVGFLHENGKMRIWLDGTEVDLTLLGDSFVADDIYSLMAMEASAPIPAVADGNTVSIESISNISDMQTPFPADAVDACGKTR